MGTMWHYEARSLNSELFTPTMQHSNLNSLPADNILDCSKLKAFADDKMNVAQMMISVLDKVNIIVRKGANAGSHLFSFQKASFPRSLKSSNLQ